MDSFTIHWLNNRFRNRIVVNKKDGSILVYVPPGKFEMGDGGNSDCPRHTVYLMAYWVGIFTVTNAQYLNFLEETKIDPPENHFFNDPDYADYPVTNVSWDDAVAYATWAGCQLPTEAQWEKAARGPQGYDYPWGQEWDPKRCQHDKSLGKEGPRPVYDYPEGVSGYGTYNQSGNVCEWCRDFYEPNFYQYSVDRNPECMNGDYRINRGAGYWNGGAKYFRNANRNKNDPGYRTKNLGFRIVKESINAS